MAKITTWIVSAAVAVMCVSLAYAQDLELKNRKEMKRADLTGTKMEVILSTTEYQPGESIPRHIHHGEEAFYVPRAPQSNCPMASGLSL